MKLIETIIILGTSLLLLAACGGKKDKQELVDLNTGKRITNENLNIIITPDLSNRVGKGLYPKPVSDISLISSVFDSYYPDLYGYSNRITGQKDVLNLAFTNANIINEYNYKGKFFIDINKKETENSLYLKTFDGSQTQFKRESIKFVKSLNEIYEQARITPAGADIFSFFKNKLKNIIKKDVLNKKVQNYVIDTKFRNILVLFTDGYLEAGLYGSSNCEDNKCYFLDGRVIRKFRKDYKENANGLNLKTFFDENEYGIIPVVNDNLKDVEVFVCELYDRSLNRRTGSQTVIPNDLDIIKIFWSDWLKKSGFKRSKLYEKVNSVDEFQANFISFINH